MTALSAGFNLLPAPRRSMGARRRVLRAWYAAIGAGVAGALVSGVAIRAGSMEAGGENARAIADLRGQIALSEAAIARERALLVGLRRDAETLELVRRRPDWTHLIAACARAVGEGGVLERITLEPASPSSPPRLAITGWAAEQTDVASGVLALERTGLLSGVRLVESKRAALGKSEAVRFSIEAFVVAKEATP
ncbi:MAG: PilN domain-containing protein [Phycisphaerales bacterium]|jgi:hypothetical protein|nr:PilN domain-containing protein [Phycisphaerales bacterium]